MKVFRAMGIAILAFGAVVSAFGQAVLDTKTKFSLYKEVISQAEKVADKDPNMARYYLLAVLSIADKVQKSDPNELKPYLALCNKLWPDAVTAANAEAQMAKLKSAMDEYKQKLTVYSIGMDFQNPHDSMSFEQWADYVIKAKKSIPDAERTAGEYATKAPHPAIHLSQPGVNAGAYQLLPCLFNILISETFADTFLKQDILPRSLKKAEEEVKASAAFTDVFKLMYSADHIKQLAGYALAVDKDNAQAKGYIKDADGLVEKANKIYAAKVKENRMPGEIYKGTDKETLRKTITDLYAKAYPKEKVVKIAITGSDWVERAEAWWQGDVLKSGVFRTISAAIAVEKADGKVRVFYEKFAREWTGRGDTFTDAYHSGSLGTSYEMLKANL